MKGIPYQDLGGPDGLPEDQRIRMIADQARRQPWGRHVAVFLDDDDATVARYRTKLEAAGCIIGKATNGPVKGVVTLVVIGKPY